jgi:hypothetical protein
MTATDGNVWNVEHIAAHGISCEEAEYVLDHARRPYPEAIGRDKWLVRGQTASGKYIQVIFVIDPTHAAYIIHSRGLTSMEKRRLRRRMR